MEADEVMVDTSLSRRKSSQGSDDISVDDTLKDCNAGCNAQQCVVQLGSIYPFADLSNGFLQRTIGSSH